MLNKAMDLHHPAPRWTALLLALALFAVPGPAAALEAIVLSPGLDRIDLTSKGELFEGRGDRLQPETAAGLDSVPTRLDVPAVTAGTNPNWFVFALTNPAAEPVERWLTAERYSVVGSGAIWPDLDTGRITNVTPSYGFQPVRIPNERADIFKITVEPGRTVTFVAELASGGFPRMNLWKPVEYELKVRDRQLFNGILLGLTGLLAIFLTVIFAANHKIIFPAAALVAWCVLGHLCVDFGFFHKLFQLRPEDNAVYRAAFEAATAASLVVFLYAFLRLGLGLGLIRMLLGVWILGQFALVAIAVIDPRLASTFARLSFLLIGGAGALFIGFLAFRGQDRALSLVPTWILFLVWIFGASVVLTGRLAGDAVVSGLAGGLVLNVLLIGFTVTQFAFRSVASRYGEAPNEGELRSLAVDGAGCAVWEWNGRRDEIKVGRAMEETLGLPAGDLNRRVEGFAQYLHEADRERFKLMLWSIQEREGARIRLEFRMRHADGSYRWFELEAASVTGADRRSIHCVGLCRDVTDTKRAHKRLLQDSVHDTLTRLPNKALLLDRIGVAMQRTKSDKLPRPTLLYIDIDRFKSINTSLGSEIGDSLLLTTARRLQRHLGPCDTLARVGGDQFAILLTAEQQANQLASLAERVRRSLRAPIKIAGHDVVLTGSLGIAIVEAEATNPEEAVKDAEIAMYRAKRQGADRIEIFRPEMRGERDDRATIEAELRKALEKTTIRVLYQPIVYLPTEDVVGFEAVLRWDHPKYGSVSPDVLLGDACPADLAIKLGSFALVRAAQEAARWHKELPPSETPIFAAVNVASRHWYRHELAQEVRHVTGRETLPKGALRLEIAEELVMQNPELSSELLELLNGAGASLALDHFGAGYCSLAYVQKLPFDTIKIDQALAGAGRTAEGGDSSVLRSVTAFARELGRKTVAQGVVTEADAKFLRSIGCEFGQGSFYDEPMSEREAMQLLKALGKAHRKARSRGFFRTTLKKRSAAAANGADAQPAEVRRGIRPGPPAAKSTVRHRPRAQAGFATAPPAPATPRANGTNPPRRAAQPPRAGPPSRPPPPAPARPPPPAAPSPNGPPVSARPPPGPVPMPPGPVAMPPPRTAPFRPQQNPAPPPAQPLPPQRPMTVRTGLVGTPQGSMAPAPSALPPGVAESLARLAGKPIAPTQPPRDEVTPPGAPPSTTKRR